MGENDICQELFKMCLVDKATEEKLKREHPLGQKYGNMPNRFQTNLCEAPCKNPGCCCIAFCCPLCAVYNARTKVLDGDMSRYICCQGYFPKCCCFNPGHMGEQSAPECCLCIEACCCIGLSVSASRMVVMDAKQIQPDPCDYRLMCFSNFLKILSCICDILAIFIPELRDLADLIRFIADLVFYIIVACIVAQIDLELKAGPYTAPTSHGTPAVPMGVPNSDEMKR